MDTSIVNTLGYKLTQSLVPSAFVYVAPYRREVCVQYKEVHTLTTLLVLSPRLLASCITVHVAVPTVSTIIITIFCN